MAGEAVTRRELLEVPSELNIEPNWILQPGGRPPRHTQAVSKQWHSRRIATLTICMPQTFCSHGHTGPCIGHHFRLESGPNETVSYNKQLLLSFSPTTYSFCLYNGGSSSNGALLRPYRLYQCLYSTLNTSVKASQILLQFLQYCHMRCQVFSWRNDCCHHGRDGMAAPAFCNRGQHRLVPIEQWCRYKTLVRKVEEQGDCIK